LLIHFVDLARLLVSFFFERITDELNPVSLDELTAECLQSLFLEHIRSQGLSARRTLKSALRSFFKYCYFSKITASDLSLAIPTLHTYKLATVPRAIEESDIQNVFNQIDRETAVGKRDYAITLLLYHYGVRGAQVRALRLTDINWHQLVIHFPACKGGKIVSMPLVAEVAEALIDYLKNSRPSSNEQQLFLTSRAPYRPMMRSSTLSAILYRYQHSAQIALSNYGSHCYRHGFATRALRQGYPLKSIADCLGHRCLQSTTIYTKVDAQSLSDIPLELPGGVL